MQEYWNRRISLSNVRQPDPGHQTHFYVRHYCAASGSGRPIGDPSPSLRSTPCRVLTLKQRVDQWFGQQGSLQIEMCKLVLHLLHVETICRNAVTIDTVRCADWLATDRLETGYS